MIKILTLFTLTSLIMACASTPTHDPLKNTKHLVKEGHKSLYQNGAFHVPNTELNLIPAGPDAWKFAKELSGLKARQSFLTSLQNAKDSVQVISIGSQKTYELSSDIFVNGNNFADSIRQYSRPNSILLIKKSYPHAKHIIGTSWDSAKSTSSYLAETSDNIVDSSLYGAKELNIEGSKLSTNLFEKSWHAGTQISVIALNRVET